MIVLTLVSGCGKAKPTETAALPTGTPVSESASAPLEASLPSGSGGGAIAFFSDRDGNDEIYLMNADGKRKQYEKAAFQN